ncbi:PEPxxWA-CTERM sorting domain-containing protein [uncultured Sphingomonas sp.]|uniref:PEPxxWA-CTERM sorting domain-containing protein n=1 Tax=uncultured Sphingomonas sp. TaxID=158754 RepID=UPI0035CC319E
MGGTLKKRLAMMSATISFAMLTSSADALVINNYFSYYLRSSPRADEIMAAINYSSRAFEAALSNDVTVNIQYDLSNDNNYLARAGYAGSAASKDDYLEMMQDNAAAHPENTVLAQAIKDIGKGNFANRNLTEVLGSTAQFRANGIPAVGNYDIFTYEDGTPIFDLGGEALKGGGLDGVVSLASIGEMLFGFDIPAYDGTPQSIRYAAINTIQHEIMHVLGGGNTSIGSETYLEPLDMFRYSAPGVANFGEPGLAYFSIDGGKTAIQEFYWQPIKAGDPNGWGPITPCSTGYGMGGPIGLFMDSISCSNQPTVTLSLDSPEGIQLMALGWNPRVAAVPEAATWTMMILGFGGIGAALRRRHRKPTSRVRFV